MSRWALVIACLAVLAAASAQAQTAPAGSIRVQVNGAREVSGAGAQPGAAEVKDLASGQTRSAPLNSSGRADVSGLPDGAYAVTVNPGNRQGTTYINVRNGQATTAEFSALGLPTGFTLTSTPASLVDQARFAAERCDRAAYDEAVSELDRTISLWEINLRDLNRLIEQYGNLTNLPPDQQRLQTLHDAILSPALRGRPTPGARVTSAGAPVDPGLVHLSAYLAVVKEKARIEQQLAAWRAARAQVPAFSAERCAREAERMLQRVALQFLLAPELSIVLANRPQFAPFRLELGGIISKLGAFKPDNTETGTQVGASLGMRWDSALLGTKQMGIEAKLWYVDYKYEDSGEVTAEPGGTIGIFSPPTAGNPFGGYFTGGPLSNGWYDAKVKSYGGEVQVQTWFESGNVRVMPWVGMRLGRTTIDENMSFDIGMPAFTTFEQRNDIKDTYFGPTIGLRARVDISGGLYGYVEGGVGLEYHKAKGDWQTLVPIVDTEPRKDSLSNSKWGISAGVKAGLGWQIGKSFSFEAGIGVNYTNASPYLEYKEDDSTTTGTGGADIGYGSQTDVFGTVRTTFRF